MKKFFTSTFLTVITLFSFAQSPQLINYQGVARDVSGNVLANQAVGLKIDIRQTTATGIIVFEETHSITTNTFGLFNIKIGDGTPTLGSIASIDWSAGPYFIETSMDATGGTSYLPMGVAQMLSVPYALYAETSGSGGATGPQGPTGANGTDGVDGATGPQGPTGANGTDGVDGATGPQGPTGANGTDGVDGATGPQGPTGANGTDGTDGATGPQGPTGADGTDGVDGATGPQGPTGANGTDGVDGATGPQGPTGANGTDGVDGATGPQGPTGSDANAIFALSGNITSNENGTYASDDFVFGSPQLDDDSDTDHDSRMFFDKSKSAFRVGQATDSNWNDSSVGNYSFASGFNTIANANFSTAFGYGTIASSNYTTAMGFGTTASGFGSTATGEGTTASGDYAITLGSGTTASGTFTTAMGYQTTASGRYSTAIGRNTTAESGYETVLGIYDTDYSPSSTVGWNFSDRLFVVGNGTAEGLRSDAMVVLKSGNTGIGVSDPDAKLEVAGQIKITGGFPGANKVLTSDASGLATWQDPISGSGAFTTAANVTSNSPGNFDTDDFVFGSPQLNDDGNADHDNRLLFDKDLGAFRAGSVDGVHWDTDSLGLYSTAFGRSTRATGDESTAMGSGSWASGAASTALGGNSTASGGYSFAGGWLSQASGDRSFAFGEGAVASGDYSTAFGFGAQASGLYAVAIGLNGNASGLRSFSAGGIASGIRSFAIGGEASGYAAHTWGGNTAASGNYATAMGFGTKARSYVETTLGNYNTDYTPISTTGWNAADRLLVVGNGSSSNNPSNAMVILKNGNVGINTSVPNYPLEVVGSAAKPGGGTWTAISDKRLKQNVNAYTDGLDAVLAIEPITYHYNKASGLDTKKEYVGVMAQDLKEVAPYMVGTFQKDEQEYFNVDNSAMVYMLINAVKEQQQQIEQQQLQILELKAENEKLKTDQADRLRKIELQLGVDQK